MSAYVFPLEQLMENVSAVLAGRLASSPPHMMGERKKQTLKQTPYYVWLPTTSDDPKQSNPKRSGDRVRSLMIMTEMAEVHVRGPDLRVTMAMRDNLINAMNEARGPIDAAVIGGFWESARAIYNADGDLYILRIGQRVPVNEGYIDLTTLQQPQQSSVVATSTETRVESTDNLDTEGELALVVKS